MPILRLSETAQSDIVSILTWTEENFGDLGRRRYEALLVTGLRDLAADPFRPGTISRPEIGDAVRSYHLIYSRERSRQMEGIVRRPRHLVLFRSLIPGIIGVGRILHDSMELDRHMPQGFGDE